MIHRFSIIDSTNTRAKEMAEAGAPQGTVLIADRQTGGRGRLGRSFHSPAGTGIYFSMILRPRCTPDKLMHLTCAVAVAMCDAVEEATGFRPGIKWTNDLVSGKQKLGGILTELGFAQGLVDYAIVGIGINCNQRKEDFPPELQDMAASLAMVTGTPVDKAALEQAMVQSLETMSRQLLTEKKAILTRYRADCVTLGREVLVVRDEESRHGTALDIDEAGALLVCYSDGTRELVSSGEVSIRGMYGYL